MSEAAPRDPAADLRPRLAPGGCDARLLDRQLLLTPQTMPRLYGGEATLLYARFGVSPTASETQRPSGGEFTPLEPQLLPGKRPVLDAAAQELAGNARPGLARATALNRALARLRPIDFDGRDRAEEAILASGEATPLERARLLALLAQAAGIASRVCLLYREPAAQPAFHAVCELFIMGAWAVFDPLAGQLFLMTHRPYASAWDLARDPQIAARHPEHGRKPTLDASFYRTVGIANVEIEG
ncbi:MAG TPA: transglutaminase domain-containing protein [Dehalococcoidia bacterium]|nr:transglutaminase domain-containing protein [Dehalococcoidia bacterium]